MSYPLWSLPWRRCLVILLVVLVVPGLVFALDVGEVAPDFTLPSTLGAPIQLSQFKGKKHVLIEFYSLDFNPT